MSESLVMQSNQAILDAGKMVANMMWQEYEPLPQAAIDGINSAPNNHKSQFSITSGSIRHFSTEDVTRRNTIKVAEMYYNNLFRGRPGSEHLLTVSLDHAYDNYLVLIDLDEGHMLLETDKASTKFWPEKSPKVARRVLGSLAIVADALI
jgi:hypothetical protein